MEVEEIPSDELVIMSDKWHSDFNEIGCDPMCHCCNKMIKIGGNFKLSITSTFRIYPPYKRYNNSIDVMLCGDCTVDQYEEKEVKKLKDKWEYKEPANPKIPSNIKSSGCFRINGKIVH